MCVCVLNQKCIPFFKLFFNVGSYLYSTPEQLFKRLQGFCKHPHLVRRHVIQVGIDMMYVMFIP